MLGLSGPVPATSTTSQLGILGNIFINLLSEYGWYCLPQGTNCTSSFEAYLIHVAKAEFQHFFMGL